MAAATSGNKEGSTSPWDERSGVWEQLTKKRATEMKGRGRLMDKDVMKPSLQRKINSKK